MKRLRESPPPRGLKRALYRLPIALYRVGLGGLLGRRFLLLHHRGRRSGLPRQAVLEVLRHDAARDAWLVSSGWGERADWYRNLRVEPEARIQVGRHRHAVRARFLADAEAEREALEYARRHPRALVGVAWVIGFEVDPADEEDVRALARELRLVALEPRASQPPS